MAKKELKPVGRPSKWTPETREQILVHLENGASFKRAAILSGVSQSTFHEWKAQGEEDLKDGKDTDYSVFLEQIYMAQETYIAWLQEKANDGAKVDGKLALEILARKRPEEFGRKDKLDIKGNFNIANFDVELTPEEVEAYKQRMKDMYGEDLE